MRRLFERFSGRNEKKDTSKARTFKLKRAQMRQKETLQELAAAQQGKKTVGDVPKAGASKQWLYYNCVFNK